MPSLGARASCFGAALVVQWEPMKILHFADLHLGMENYGRIDSARSPFAAGRFPPLFRQLIELALAENVDLVLFAAMPTARVTHRLPSSGHSPNNPAFACRGHSGIYSRRQPRPAKRHGRANSVEIFDTLSVTG